MTFPFLRHICIREYLFVLLILCRIYCRLICPVKALPAHTYQLVLPDIVGWSQTSHRPSILYVSFFLANVNILNTSSVLFSQLLADIEDHLNVTIQQVEADFNIPADEFDGKVVYGQKRANMGMVI